MILTCNCRCNASHWTPDKKYFEQRTGVYDNPDEKYMYASVAKENRMYYFFPFLLRPHLINE